MDRQASSLQSAFKTGFLVLIFEFLGSLVLPVFLRMLPGVYFIFAFFFLVSICANISGSHFNPAVTIVFLLRKDPGKFSRPMAFAYIIVQFAGTFCGAMLAWMWLKDGGIIRVADDKYIIQA